MAEAVDWQDPAAPRSTRFNDRYGSCAGALTQARQVFLQGCGLPQAWSDQPRWTVLETGFGLGANFLSTWQAWVDDPQRPALLHFVSVEAHPVSAADLLRSATAYPELLPLARQLCELWQDWTPGWHRLRFAQGRVLLTLCVGDVKAMLRQANFSADAVFLDGFSPQRNPDMWDAYTLKAVARLCRRGTRLATWTVAREVRDSLTQCGFLVQMVAGLPPKRDRLEASFEPAWEPRKRVRNEQDHCATKSCLVIGAGLAGAAVAASLARRGCQVTVLDAAADPAAGASGLPAGLVVPHVSSDDSLLSRLCRAGAQATWQQVQELLREGEDYALTGVRERCLDEGAVAPEHWHTRAGWLKPAQLVRALLAQPGVRFQGQSDVQDLRRQGDVWQALDEAGQVLAQANRVVVCAGFASHALLQQALALQALRGQLSWGWRDTADTANFPETPVNGRGNFIPQVPTAQGMAWYLGSSFARDDTDARPKDADHLANLARLQSLLPETAQALAGQFPGGALANVQSFCAVRCSSPDRLPVLGPVDAAGQPGLWVSTAMGARGLTLAVLCGELLAAQWFDEPAPLEDKLAQAMFSGRRILQPRPAKA